jgi:hypothetical protein
MAAGRNLRLRRSVANIGTTTRNTVGPAARRSTPTFSRLRLQTINLVFGGTAAPVIHGPMKKPRVEAAFSLRCSLRSRRLTT